MANTDHTDEPEEWKPVAGYEGYYQVSSLGRVKRLARYVNYKDNGRAWRRERILAVDNTGWKYPRVCLSRDGAARNWAVHRLVCGSFHGPPPTPTHQVAHSDGSRRNNRAGNLRWATGKENADDCILHGTRLRGEKLWNAKLTEDDVKAIRAEHQGKYGDLERLAKSYGLTRAAIGHIVKRRSWKHI